MFYFNYLCNFQAGILLNKEAILWRCTLKELFWVNHWKTTVKQQIFTKNVLCYWCFSKNLAKIYRTAILMNYFWWWPVVFFNPLINTGGDKRTYTQTNLEVLVEGLLTGIEIAVRHQTLSNKKCYMSGTHVSQLDILSYIKTCLAYHIAYYKSIIKWLYTFIQQTIKWEHTCCTQLPLFTFTLNSGDTWSFYIFKVFLMNINSRFF